MGDSNVTLWLKYRRERCIDWFTLATEVKFMKSGETDDRLLT
jgi:hypothetical protein